MKVSTVWTLSPTSPIWNMFYSLFSKIFYCTFFQRLERHPAYQQCSLGDRHLVNIMYIVKILLFFTLR